MSGGPVTSRNLHHLHVSIWKARATHARRYEVAYCVTSSSFETSDGTVDWEQTSKVGNILEYGEVWRNVKG